MCSQFSWDVFRFVLFRKLPFFLRPTPFLEFSLCPQLHDLVLTRPQICHVRRQTGQHCVTSQPGNLSSPLSTEVRYRNTCIFSSHAHGSLALGNVTHNITVQLHRYRMGGCQLVTCLLSPTHLMLCSLNGPRVSQSEHICLFNMDTTSVTC